MGTFVRFADTDILVPEYNQNAILDALRAFEDGTNKIALPGGGVIQAKIGPTGRRYFSIDTALAAQIRILSPTRRGACPVYARVVEFVHSGGKSPALSINGLAKRDKNMKPTVFFFNEEAREDQSYPV